MTNESLVPCIPYSDFALGVPVVTHCANKLSCRSMYGIHGECFSGILVRNTSFDKLHKNSRASRGWDGQEPLSGHITGLSQLPWPQMYAPKGPRGV